MTLDEAIKIQEDIAEENQKIIDTRIIFDDVTLDEFFCDDTEVIEEHLVRYQRCADEHRQIAEWLKELKDYNERYESYLKKSGIVISQLREDRDRLLDALDKIKDEIMQLDYDLEDIEYDHNDMAQTEAVHIISREDVLRIIKQIKESKKNE